MGQFRKRLDAPGKRHVDLKAAEGARKGPVLLHVWILWLRSLDQAILGQCAQGLASVTQ